MNIRDILYLLFVILTLSYTVIDSFVIIPKKKKIFLVFIYVPAAMIYLGFTINYLFSANKAEFKLDNTINAANIQEGKLRELISTSQKQNERSEYLTGKSAEQEGRLKVVARMAKLYEDNFNRLIKGEMIVKSLSIKVRYIINTKTKADQIVPYNWKVEGYLVNKKNTIEDYNVRQKNDGDLKLISPVTIKYPDEKTVEILFDFAPADHKELYNKQINVLSKYYAVRLFFGKGRFVIKEELEPVFTIESYIYLNDRLYHKQTILSSTKYNTHTYWIKDGLFDDIENKYLRLIGLHDNASIIYGNTNQ